MQLNMQVRVNLNAVLVRTQPQILTKFRGTCHTCTLAVIAEQHPKNRGAIDYLLK